MIKKILHSALLIAAISCVVLFAGCLKFESSFDILSSAPDLSSEAPSSSEQHTESTEAPTEEPSSEENISSQEPSSESEETETTTKAPEESTTQASSTPENSEYDILRTGEFSFVGSINTGGEIMEVNISVGKDKIYFSSELDGLEIGLYVDGKKTFIYAPEYKKYLKMNSIVARLLQMDPDMFVEITEQLGFDKLPPLSTTDSVESGSLSGVTCEVYTFNRPNNTVMHTYMNGEKMLKIEYINSNGDITHQISFKKVTAGFPQMPPDGYEEMGYIEFFMLIAEDL